MITTLHIAEYFIESHHNLHKQIDDTEIISIPVTIGGLTLVLNYFKSVCVDMFELVFQDSRPTTKDHYKTAVLGPTEAKFGHCISSNIQLLLINSNISNMKTAEEE